MFASEDHELLDFGDGRRLERFGPLVLDRPCPSVESGGIARSNPSIWNAADARFERTGPNQGQWTTRGELPERWTIRHGRFMLELKRTEFGHLGVFPEQAVNWDWLTAVLQASKTAAAGCPTSERGELPRLLGSGLGAYPKTAAAGCPASERGELPKLLGSGLKILNLFAYTGGSTLAAAAAGAKVTHVDAAKNVVAWARRNAELSGLTEAPIRWIAEDAQKFVRRELQRGNRYDGVILDPPSYGHGTHGEVWRLSKHLPRLLAQCGELLGPEGRFLLLTCHTPDFDAPRMRRLVEQSLGVPLGGRLTALPLVLDAATGGLLASGISVCWEREPFQVEPYCR